MSRFISIKSAAAVCVAVAATCFASQDASAQCVRGGGFGGGGFSGISIGYSSGFGNAFRPGYGFNGIHGINGFNNFGRGVSINVGRPVYPVRGFNNVNFNVHPRGFSSFGVPVQRSFYRYGHRGW